MPNWEVKMGELRSRITKAIKTAEEAVKEVSELEEKFTGPAFEVVLRYLLETGFENQDVAVAKTYKAQVSSAPDTIKIQSFPGLLRRLNAKSHADKVLAIAYYFLNYKNKVMFTKEDVEKEYQSALLPKSKNTSAEINSLIQRGHLMPNGEKIEGRKSYSITQDGIAYVEEKLKKKQ